MRSAADFYRIAAPENVLMKKPALFAVLPGIVAAALAIADPGGSTPSDSLRVVIIRHGEKPNTGDNLSCKGENRALLLAEVLHQKFNVPDYLYVPSIGQKKSDSHARMFETIIPFAVKYGLKINSTFAVDAYSAAADQVLHKSGTVLMVWEHGAIPALAEALGVRPPPKWKGKDFDSIWIITYTGGKASLSIDREGIAPSAECRY